MSNEEKEAIINEYVNHFKKALVGGRLIEGEEFRIHLRAMPTADFESLNEDWAILCAGE